SSTQLLFEVRDSGIGIAEQAQSKIFEKFEQADLSTTREYGGSGLGLSICKKLVDLYNGEIWVESQPGVGSSFFVRLKLSEAEAPEKDSAQAMNSQGQINARVLVAEDNPVNQKVIAAMLNKFGVDYDLAHNGEEALALVCDGRHYDLIFMDCEMPKMDGYESTRRFRQWEQQQKRSGVRICALTSHAMAEHRDQCLAAGMDDHLAKPVTLQSLRQVLARSLASASS
ncbi:MAG: response regulator, partial [Pseudomonadota bacterium]|nr:response regulator [Pseudomonadota bacterium]